MTEPSKKCLSNINHANVSPCQLVCLAGRLASCLEFCAFLCLPVFFFVRFIRPSVCRSVSFLSACPSVRLFPCLFVYLSISLILCPSNRLSVCLSFYLSVCLPSRFPVFLPLSNNYAQLWTYEPTTLCSSEVRNNRIQS